VTKEIRLAERAAIKSPGALRAETHRAKLGREGVKKYRGSTGLHPAEHAAVVAVVEWIKRRRKHGQPGSMHPLMRIVGGDHE